MRRAVLLAVLLAAPAAAFDRFATYANPIDLNYRMQSPGPARREAADPTAVNFHGETWLFASKSGGYWHSRDLLHWTFIVPTGLPLEAYAPTALVIADALYFTAGSGTTQLFTTVDPASGQWHAAGDLGATYDDPALFRDDDGRLFVADGLSATAPLRVTELDRTLFKPLARAEVPATRATETQGWQVRTDEPGAPTYVEGAWLNKLGGRDYLQYAAPATEAKGYADGVVVADAPMGPYRAVAANPFSFKPTGFVAGAGHGSTFAAADGRLWHVATMTISVRHPWERRLGLFPAALTPGGGLIADTYLGDWPHRLDGDRGLAGWMLLSRHAAASASSSVAGFEPAKAADDDVRTWWAAASGNPGEWFALDLGATKTIEAVQINFADDGARADAAGDPAYRYVLEASGDGHGWKTLVDHRTAATDHSHDYEVLPRAVAARFVRLRNIASPNGARFSLYDLRVFGRFGARPAAVGSIVALRDSGDARRATIRWAPSRGAQFYVVRLGPTPATMSQSYQIYDGATSTAVGSLTAGVPYLVAVDAVSQGGIARGPAVALRG